MSDEVTTEDVSTPEGDATPTSEGTVSEGGSNEITLDPSTGEQVEAVSEEKSPEPQRVDWAEILKGKKAKAYGKEIDLSEKLTDEAKVIEALNKGFAFDKVTQERAQMERDLALLKNQNAQLQQKYQEINNPSKYAEENPQFKDYVEDYIWENYAKAEATPEEIQAYEAKKAIRERDLYKQQAESVSQSVEQQRAQQIAEQQRSEAIEHYSGQVHKAITEHEHLKHIQSNPMVASELLYWMRAAENKGIKTTPERLANHAWNSILEKTILPVLENVPVEFLNDKLGGYSKRVEEWKKSQIKDPEQATPTNGTEQKKSKPAKDMREIYKQLGMSV